MEDFLQFFAELNSAQKLSWVIITLFFFWVVEGLYPLFRFGENRWKYAKLNLLLLTFTIVINALFGVLTFGVTEYVQTQNIGLLEKIDLPLVGQVIVAVLILDFIVQYVAHFLLHKVPFMWRLHMVHHSDTHVNVTTGTRHHPLDYIVREIFALIAIFLGGIPFGMYMLYRIMTVLFTYFTHANLELPRQVDRFISYLFVSPNMHKFHHHYERPWTDSNYGNMFSIWDRLFGTFVYNDPTKVNYGLDVTDGSQAENFRYQIGLPFNKDIKTDQLFANSSEK